TAAICYEYNTPNSAFRFGYPDGPASEMPNATAGVKYDTRVGATVLRWGNYDVFSNAVRWNSSEVPSGISPYANAVPASTTLPASFYLPGRPSWWGTPWGTPAWPAIGPDV